MMFRRRGHKHDQATVISHTHSDPFRYLFHVDVEFDSVSGFEEAMEAVRGSDRKVVRVRDIQKGLFVNE